MIDNCLVMLYSFLKYIGNARWLSIIDFFYFRNKIKKYTSCEIRIAIIEKILMRDGLNAHPNTWC